MRKWFYSGLALLALTGTASAFNLDGNKAFLEPAQTFAEANQIIELEKAKCPYEFFTKDTAVAYFHIKKGEKYQNFEAKDDRTLVQGFVCQETVYSWWTRRKMAIDRRFGPAGFVGIGVIGGGILSFLLVYFAFLGMVKPNYKIQEQRHAEALLCSGCGRLGHPKHGGACDAGGLGFGSSVLCQCPNREISYVGSGELDAKHS